MKRKRRHPLIQLIVSILRIIKLKRKPDPIMRKKSIIIKVKTFDEFKALIRFCKEIGIIIGEKLSSEIKRQEWKGVATVEITGNGKLKILKEFEYQLEENRKPPILSPSELSRALKKTKNS